VRSFLIFFLLFTSLLVNGQKAYQVLFVGNSLTYTNDLPELVEKEAAKVGLKLKTKMIAFPNYAIEDHWRDGEVQKYLKTSKYDFLILQQGPSSQKEGRDMLLEIGALFKKLCTQSDTRLAYLMVWPSKGYYHTFDGVIQNYRDAAKMNDALLFPVGRIWKEHFDETNDYSYYGIDGFHPSLRGSQVAAEVITKSILSERAELNK